MPVQPWFQWLLNFHIYQIRPVSAASPLCPYFLGVNDKYISATTIVNPSFDSSSNFLPSSPGANAMSNDISSHPITVRSSMYARALPIQPQNPSANGMKADLFLISSGLLYQRSGMNSRGRT